MPRKARELSALEVARIARGGNAGLYAIGGVAGLYLQVVESGAVSWILLIMIGGRRREMGLGGYPDVTLAQAREKARIARDDVEKGIDPIEKRRAAQSALRAESARAWTFKACAKAFIEGKAPEWKNKKHAAQWTTTLERYAYPKIGDMLARDVELPHVLSVVQPIWTTTTETASRVRNRIELVLDWATVRGYREGLNPARWRGHLDKILPKPSKVARVEHHRALPDTELGAFMQALRKQDGTEARALEFVILTVCRSGEARGAKWSEIDTDHAVWTIPGSRMKSARAHRVPLSPEALRVLEQMPRIPGEDSLVFPAQKGGQLADKRLAAVIRRMGVDVVPHGFRSVFADWCGERTNYPREVAEMALAHAIGNKTEEAYRRGDLFDRRRKLMNEWATFCSKVEPKRGAVVPLREHAG